MSPSLLASLLSDDPLDALDDAGLFGRDHFVARTIEILGRVRVQSNSSTLSLIGAWGSGKTTVLNALVRHLREPDDAEREALGSAWSVAEFNPWLYSDPASLHAGFFSELRDALPREERWNEARKRLADFGRRLTPLTSVTQLFGINSKDIVEGALAQLEPSTTAQRRAVEAAMTDVSQPVLMIIDDLDRLSAEELLHVFKLVRLVGRLPNVYYLLSYDEHTIVDLLGKTDLVAADDERRALDYLEKIVQVRLDMPMLREHEVDAIVDSALESVARAHGLEVENKPSLVRRFDSVMSARLRTPRALKRLFGQLDAFLGAVGSEVSFDDFVVMTWFRTVEPGVYGLIQERKAELLGTGGDALRRLAQPKMTNAQMKVEWLRRLNGAQVAEAHQDDVLYLLTSVFPALDGVYGGDDREHGRPSQGGSPEPTPGRISHPDYFDRFFAFGVPSGDIPDTAVRAAARELQRAERGSNLNLLEETFHSQPELVLRKLADLTQTQDIDRPSLIRWLGIKYHSARFFGLIESRIEGLVAELFADLSSTEAEALAHELSVTDSGLHLVGSAQRLLAGQQYGAIRDVERLNGMGDVLAPVVMGLLSRRLSSLVDEVDSPLEASIEASRLRWLWRGLDPESFRRLLAAAAESGRWGLVDELAWFVACSIGSDGVFYIGRFSEISAINDLFDREAVMATLAEEIDKAETWDHSRDVPATPAALRLFTLAALRLARKTEQDG